MALEAADPYSQSKDMEGRRIVRLDEGGWFVVNGAKYRDMLSVEKRREYQRNKQAEYRAKKKAAGNGGFAEVDGSGEIAEKIGETMAKQPEFKAEPAKPAPVVGRVVQGRPKGAA